MTFESNTLDTERILQRNPNFDFNDLPFRPDFKLDTLEYKDFDNKKNPFYLFIAIDYNSKVTKDDINFMNKDQISLISSLPTKEEVELSEGVDKMMSPVRGKKSVVSSPLTGKRFKRE